MSALCQCRKCREKFWPCFRTSLPIRFSPEPERCTVNAELRPHARLGIYFMGSTMHLILKSAALLFLFIQSAPVWAAKDINANNGPIIGEDLTFPAAPEPFGYAKASKM